VYIDSSPPTAHSLLLVAPPHRTRGLRAPAPPHTSFHTPCVSRRSQDSPSPADRARIYRPRPLPRSGVLEPAGPRPRSGRARPARLLLSPPPDHARKHVRFACCARAEPGGRVPKEFGRPPPYPYLLCWAPPGGVRAHRAAAELAPARPHVFGQRAVQPRRFGRRSSRLGRKLGLEAQLCLSARRRLPRARVLLARLSGGGESLLPSSEMVRGDLKHMSLHDFAVFLFLLALIAALGSCVLARLIRLCTMSKEEELVEAGTADQVEMQTLLTERQLRGLGI